MGLQTWSETLITAQGDGTANTTGVAASLLPTQAKKTLDPGFWSTPGKQMLLRASGRTSSVITTPGTSRFDVRFGGTVVFDGLAMLLDAAAAANNVGWYLELLLTQRAVGNVANLMGQGWWTSPNLLGSGTRPLGALTAMLPWNTAPVVGSNFDATVTQQVDLFYTQTVGTGSCQLHQYSLIALN